MAERELTLRLTFDNQASSALQQVIDDLEQLGIHTRQIQDSMREFGEFRGAFNEAFGDLGQPITSLADLNSQISALAGSAAASGVMMLGEAVKQSVTDFIEFETQLGDLGRTANLSGEATNALGESLRKMALVDLKGQASAQELANIATIAGTLGMSAPKDIEAFTAAIVRLSVATGENTEKVANNFARLGGLFETQFTARGENVYQSFDKIGSAFDALNDQIANVSFDPFMNISVRIGKMAASMGMSIDQTAAFAASINSLGFTAEAGSTAFKKFVTVIQSDSEKVARAFKLPVDEFVTAVRERPAEAIMMLLEQMKEMQGEGGAAMQDVAARMKQVWGSGSEVNDLMLAMSQNVDRVNQALSISSTEYEKGSRTFDSFAEKTKLASAQLKAADTAMAEMRLSMGTLLAPAIKGVSEQLAATSRDFAEFFGGLQMGDFDFGEVFKAIPAAWVQTQKDVLGMVATFVDGIAELIGAGRYWQGVEESAAATWSAITDTVSGAFNVLKEFPAAFSAEMTQIGDTWSAIWASAKEIASSVFDALKEFPAAFLSDMGTLGESWGQLWGEAKTTAEQAWQAVVASIDQQWQGIVTSIQSTGSTLWTTITESGKQVWTDLTAAAQEFWTWLTEQPAAFVAAAQAAFADIETQIKAIPANLTAAFSGIAASARNELSKITDGLPSSVQKILGLGGGTPEKITIPIDTAPTLDALSQIRASVIATGDEALRLKVNDVFGQMQKAIRDNVPVSDELQQKFTDVTQELETLGYVSHGGSVWPDMGAAITAVQPVAQSLQTQFVSMTGDLKTMGEQSSLPIVKQQIEETEARIRELKKSYGDARDAEKDMSSGASARAKALGEEIKGLKASIADKTRTVFGVEEVQQVEARIAALEREKASLTGRGAAGAAGSKQIKDAIEQEQEKLRQLKDSAKDLAEVERERERAAKEAARAAKARNDASERLFKDAQRNEELLKKAAEDRDKAEAAAYQARKREADESVQWINKLDEADKKRLFGNKEALQILESQGVVLDELQQTAVWRMEREYEVAEAQQLQLETLQAQLDPMGALLDASGQLSEVFGGLSSGIGNLGDLFGFDTSGITGFLGKLQGFAELPATIKGITDSIGGIGQALGSLGNIGGAISGLFGNLGSSISGAFSGLGGLLGGGGGLTGILGGLSGALSGVVAAAGPFALAGGAIYGAWKLLGGLFEDTKSKGTEAANAFQDFVSKNIAGGEEMAAALKTNFDAMGQANFDFQTFLTQTDTTMDQTFGGISANWQQGTTAMDIFTQAVVKSGVEESKAAQVSLQMMASFQDMGLSASEAGAKMLEIAKAAGMSEQDLKALESALANVKNAETEVSNTTETTATAVTSLGTAAESGFSKVNGILQETSDYMQSTKSSWLDFADETDLSTLTSELIALRDAGAITETQFTSFNDLLSTISQDGRVTTQEISTLTTAFNELSTTTTQTSQTITADFSNINAIVQDANGYMKETNATVLNFVDETSLSGLTSEFEKLRDTGAITETQFSALSGLLSQISDDGRVTAGEMDVLTAALYGVQNGVENAKQTMSAGMSDIVGIVKNAGAEIQKDGGSGWLDFNDEAMFGNVKLQLQSLAAQGLLTAEQMQGIMPVLEQIGDDGRVSADEVTLLQTALNGLGTTAAQAGEQASTAFSGDNIIASMGTLEEAVANVRKHYEAIGMSQEEIAVAIEKFTARAKDDAATILTNTSDIVGTIGSMFESIDFSMTDAQTQTLMNLFDQIRADGQLTQQELSGFRQEMVNVGVSTEQLDAKLKELGLTEQQLGIEMAQPLPTEPLITFNAENEKAIEIMTRMRAEAAARTAEWQAMGLSTDEINAKLQNLALTETDMVMTAFASTNPIVGALADAFDGEAASAVISTEEHTQLAQSLAKLTQDGQISGEEISQFANELTNAGVPADALRTKLLEMAEASGMDTDQLKQLEAALGQAGNGMTQTGAQAEGLSTDLTGLTDEERLAAEQAKVAAEGLTTLTGAEQTAAGGALGASSDTSQFADALQQLHREGQITKGELDALGATFGGAGGDSLGAANDIESLKSSLSDLGVIGKDADEMIKAFTASIEKIPAEKKVKITVEQSGEIPQAAMGGVVSGLAWVNERGSEIAKFPSGRMALMTAPGPMLGAFPAGTEIIPHGRSMDIIRKYPTVPRMAAGGMITPAATGAVNNYYLTINASVIDRQVIKEIDDGLRRLTARRA